MKLDLSTMQSAIVAALPAYVRWTVNGIPLDFDFSCAQRGLRELSGEICERGDKEWGNLLMFGKYDWSEGGGAAPWLCIRKTDGVVCGLDLERESAIFVLNSSLERFIQTFGLLNEYLGGGTQLPLDVEKRVRDIDPKSYPGSDWRLLVDYLG
jgi:hypothetical protein